MLQESGYTITAISYEEWQRNLLSSTIKGNALKPLDYLFKDSAGDGYPIVRRYAELRPKVDISNTLKFAKETNLTSLDIDHQVLARYLDNFKKQMKQPSLHIYK
jgi:hypothetical protein